MTTKENYVETGGVRCPYCQSENLSSTGRDWTEDELRQYISCINCRKQWTEIYILTSVDWEKE